VGCGAFATARGREPVSYWAAISIVMLLITLVTPLISAINLVTRIFSAAFFATPLTVTTPSVVSILVLIALVEREKAGTL